MKRFLTIAILLLSLKMNAQRTNAPVKIDTTNLDLTLLTNTLTAGASTDFEKAKTLLHWFSNNMSWLATDYQSRSVKEIIARGGGNCFELAKVYVAAIQAAGIRYRGIAEINIHPVKPERQETASKLVKEKGNSYSVFGLQHNDHRWVEVYNSDNDSWEPADPATGVIGLNEWLKARVWFGERKTIDTAISKDMIVPFAVFYTDEKKNPVDTRTSYYLIDKFDKLYYNRLSTLPEWKAWKEAVNSLNEPAMDAFLGKVNLHAYQPAIANIAVAYEALKKAYLKQYGSLD